MNRRVAKKVDDRVSREILGRQIRPERTARTLYRRSTLLASARVLVRELRREGWAEPAPTARPWREPPP